MVLKPRRDLVDLAGVRSGGSCLVELWEFGAVRAVPEFLWRVVRVGRGVVRPRVVRVGRLGVRRVRHIGVCISHAEWRHRTVRVEAIEEQVAIVVRPVAALSGFIALILVETAGESQQHRPCECLVHTSSVAAA